MEKPIYKGVIHSLLPQKGFGFIKPVWAKSNEDNIYFYIPETKKGRKCFIPALQSAEARTEVVKRDLRILTPVEEQVVYFELEVQLREGKPSKLIAKEITDANHASKELMEAAELNTTKPDLGQEACALALTVASDNYVDPVDKLWNAIFDSFTDEGSECEDIATETSPKEATVYDLYPELKRN